MTLTLHHLEKSRSHRILWLFEELGLDYELKEYRRNPKTFRADPALRKIHPLGKAPIVTDGDIVVAETGNIIEHVLERHGNGRLQPEPGSAEAREFRYFLHYAEGSLMPPLLVRLIFDTMENAPLPFFIKPLVKAISGKVNANFTAGEISLHTNFLEEILSKRDFITGSDFTAADIQMSYPVDGLLSRGRLEPHEGKSIRAYLKRIQGRPAYERALEKGGPVMPD